jgi:autotransporter-associated beta strand protein
MSMSPVISGTGQLTKLGTGVLTLNNTANSYSGNTNINAGILRLGTSEVIPNASAIVVTSPGILDMNTFSETLGSIEGDGIVDNVSGGGTPLLTVGGLNSGTTFSGVIKNTSGVLALTKNGTGTFRLSGSNTYSGITNVNNGLLTAQNANALGATTAGTIVANGATLVLFDYTYPSEALTISGNGYEPKGALRTSTTLSNTTVTFPGNITLAANSQIGAEIASVQFNITGVVSGAFNLTKIADGVLTLSGANTYTGITTVSVGTLKLNNTAALGTIAGGTVVSSGAALDLNGINYSALETLSIAGTGVSSGGVLFNSNATAATFVGAVTLTANSTITTANQITLSGNITPNTLDLVKNGVSTLSFVSNTASVRDLTLSAGTLNASASTINISRAFTSSGTFTAGTSTVNFVGTANQTIPALNFYNVKLNNSTGAVLGGNISVSGTITLTSGVLATGVSTVDLGANGSIVEATPNTHAPTSYVTGKVKSTRNTGSTSGTVTFGGLGLDITETTKTNNSTVVIRTTGTPKSYTLGATTYYGILRFFDITPVNDVNLNGTMVMHYFDHELNGSTEANLRIYKDSTGGWIRKAGSSPSPSTNSISLSGIKDFSLWTASDYINQPLPITLVRFVAEKNNSKQVDLKWTTASEIDNDFFTIEKSIDGSTWEIIGTIEGSGTTNETNNYSFIDSEVSRATVYYRLKQTDYDAKFEYSNVISVGSTNHSIECNLFPSPANVDNIKVLISTMELGEYNLSITNTQGLEIYNQFFNHEMETDILNLSNELFNVGSGLYHLQISKDYDKVCDQKFILR